MQPAMTWSTAGWPTLPATMYQFDDALLQRLQPRRIGATTIDNGLVVVHLDQ